MPLFLGRRKLLAQLRAAWGRPGAKDGWQVSRYFDLTRSASAAGCVDDKTWIDLEWPAIFARIDSTLTTIGSQVLYRNLRSYVDAKEELDQRYAHFVELQRNRPLREDIQVRLEPLGRRTSVADVAELIFGIPAHKPPGHHLLLFLCALSFAVPAAVVLLHWPVTLWFAVLGVNAATVFFFTPKLQRVIESLENCSHMLRVADDIASLQAGSSLPLIQRLVRESPRRAHARRQLSWFALSRDQQLVSAITFWLNVLLLLDCVACLRVIDRLGAIREELGSAFEAIGALDAATALASMLQRLPGHCVPVVGADAAIELVDAYHPLIEDPVRNSLYLHGRSALVTGSNMAGKTTFIKVVGINIVLARTVGFCLATRASVPHSGVMASIRSDQSVEQGRSRYFSEIEAILAFLRAARAGSCRVFLIDEIFSGTNTVERVAAARAVLETLSADAQVLATTHDVELQLQLQPRFDLYHFRERVDIEGFFDYRLLPGPATERNAIRLLARLGFPEEVVEKALRYANEKGPPT